MGSAYPTPLATLAQEAAFKLKRADEYRVSASILLAECKRRIDAGDPDAQGLTLAEYCRVHCPLFPPAYLHKLVGRHLFPADGVGDAENSVGSRDPLDRAWAAFITLPSARQQEFLRCGVAYTLRQEGASRQLAPDVLRWEA
jgi:hypothetical protein